MVLIFMAGGAGRGPKRGGVGEWVGGGGGGGTSVCKYESSYQALRKLSRVIGYMYRILFRLNGHLFNRYHFPENARNGTHRTEHQRTAVQIVLCG